MEWFEINLRVGLVLFARCIRGAVTMVRARIARICIRFWIKPLYAKIAASNHIITARKFYADESIFIYILWEFEKVIFLSLFYQGDERMVCGSAWGVAAHGKGDFN